MPVSLGNTSISKLYLGNTEVPQAYLGSTQVFNSTPPNGLLNGLVSYYKADTSGSFPDAHGSNDGTINGATYTANGKINGGYDFDGNNDFISTNYALQAASSTTLSCWVNWDGKTSEYNALIADHNTSLVYNYNLLINIPNGEVQCQIRGKGTVIGSTFLTPGVWYHIVMVHDVPAGNAYIYLNGVQDGILTTGTPTTVTGGGLNIGRVGDFNLRYFQGIMDEVLFYNRALSSQEKSDLYNSGNGLSYDNFTT